MCFICPGYGTEVLLNSSNTRHTNMNLVNFLSNLTKKQISSTESVCSSCYNLINVLDEAQSVCLQVTAKLLGYLEQKKVDTSYLDQVQIHDFTIEPSEKHLSDLDKCKSGIHKNAHDNESTEVVSKETGHQIIEGTTKSIEGEILLYALDVSTGLKTYKCNLCSKTWNSIPELEVHIQAHNQDRPFICEICGQGYKQKAALEIHVGMHNGINKFTCHICNKPFTQKGALERHVLIHTGECTYQCHQCGKRFIHRTSFRVHMRSHVGIKDVKCSVCNAEFASRSHLTRHMRVHTGEKKYKCTVCAKQFAEKYNLRAHEKIHTNPIQKS